MRGAFYITAGRRWSTIVMVASLAHAEYVQQLLHHTSLDDPSDPVAVRAPR